jgi:hypothetical protein
MEAVLLLLDYLALRAGWWLRLMGSEVLNLLFSMVAWCAAPVHWVQWVQWVVPLP